MVKHLKNITNQSFSPEKGTAAALGIFDGIHLGHRAVIKKAMQYHNKGLECAIFTFNSDTLEKKHGKPFRYIYSNLQKTKILSECGADYMYCPDFETIKNMSTEEFAQKILTGKMNAKVVICGERFHFGKNASGDGMELVRLGKKYGFEVDIVPPVLYNDSAVSSTLIRSFINTGNISSANRLLGRNYEICSEVVYGNMLGRTIGLPTINQKFAENQLIPHYGVYSSRTIIDGSEYLSVTDIGVKPTIGNYSALSETHILDFSGNLYGRKISVLLDDMIREEMKFNSVDELKNAINRDISTVKKKKYN